MRPYTLYFIVVVILLMGMKHDRCIYGVKNSSNALRQNTRGKKAVKHTTFSTIEIWFKGWLLTNRILNLWVWLPRDLMMEELLFLLMIKFFYEFKEDPTGLALLQLYLFLPFWQKHFKDNGLEVWLFHFFIGNGVCCFHSHFCIWYFSSKSMQNLPFHL